MESIYFRIINSTFFTSQAKQKDIFAEFKV